MPNQTHDVHGRPYAKLSELRVGDTVEVDDGFTCLTPWTKHSVLTDEGGLYIKCAGPKDDRLQTNSKHYLNGQADDGEHCVGIYKVPT